MDNRRIVGRISNSRSRNSKKAPLTLKWGGRPYKNKNKVINIPENTKLVNGILVAKDEGKTVSASNLNIKNLIVVNEGTQFLCSKKRRSKQTGTKHQCNEENSASENSLELFNGYSPMNDLWFSPLQVFGSPGLTELFSFYVQETSQIFIVSNSGNTVNPFKTTLPQMAIENKIVMKLLSVLGGQHRKKFGYQTDRIEEDKVMKQLYDESLLELERRVVDPQEKFSFVTLACILILASIDIFFDQKQGLWRTHLYGAKDILLEKLKRNSEWTDVVSQRQKISYSVGEDRESFLTRWFMYLNVISLLSSPKATRQAEIFQEMDLDFCPSADRNNNLLAREDLKDIQPTSGMEPRILAYLSRISQMVFEKDKITSANGMEELMTQAIELDYEISNYLVTSERERDEVLKRVQPTTKNLRIYQFLRCTNLLFGLTALLLLRRRILNLSQRTTLVKELLTRISALLRDKVPLNSPAESCLLLCIFSCGCELIDSSLVSLRDVYIRHLDSLMKGGISGAKIAKTVMEECWETGLPWWEVLKTRKQHISFAI